MCLVSHIQAGTVSFGGFSLREEAKTLTPGSLFQRRDKAESTGASSVATAAAQARMASREAEKEAQMTAPVSHSSSKNSKRHHTGSSDSSSKEEAAAKRSVYSEDSEVPKKKQKGCLKLCVMHACVLCSVV